MSIRAEKQRRGYQRYGIQPCFSRGEDSSWEEGSKHEPPSPTTPPNPHHPHPTKKKRKKNREEQKKEKNTPQTPPTTHHLSQWNNPFFQNK